MIYYIEHVWEISPTVYGRLLLKRPQSATGYRHPNMENADDNCAVAEYRDAVWQMLMSDTSSNLCRPPVDGVVCVQVARGNP